MKDNTHSQVFLFPSSLARISCPHTDPGYPKISSSDQVFLMSPKTVFFSYHFVYSRARVCG